MNNAAHSLNLTTLLVDADAPLGQALAVELTGSGHTVVTHSRSTSANTDLHVEHLAGQLPGLATAHGPFDRIVFCQHARSERCESLADIVEIQRSISRSLGELRAACQILARRDDGQVWVLLPEDSMRYYLDVSSRPIETQALMGAVKSLAKEVFGFGVRLNIMHVQALADMLPQSSWRAARSDLKTYALKFKPPSALDVARLASGLLAQRQLPMSGMVMPVGIGFAEANI